MTVISTQKDPEALTLTIVAEFDAAPEQVWQLWSDPRKLELWWGPPGYPATFVAHDLVPGGRSVYYMTLDDGEKSYGWWSIADVDEPHRFAFTDGFGDENGTPSDFAAPTSGEVRLEVRDGGTRMNVHMQFPDVKTMEQLLAMGMEEGIKLAMGQMDDVLAGTLVR